MLHPIFVHFPIALGFLVPLLIVWSLIQFRKDEKNANQLWITVVIPLTMMVLFTILAIMAGDNAHEVLEKYMDEKPIKSHEEFADIFSMVLYITTGLSYFIFLFKERRRFLFMNVTLVFSLAVMGLGMITGKSGGEVVHKFDAPQYMIKAIKDGALDRLGKHSHDEKEETSEHEKQETKEKK